jgi:hypothetical protein
LTPVQRDRIGTDFAPEINDAVRGASAGRRLATVMLHEIAAGHAADGCAPVDPAPPSAWDATHRDAHEAMTGLFEAVEAATEEQLAADPGTPRNHPQYVWRDVINLAVRGPLGSYAAWHHRAGRVEAGLAVLARWYEATRCVGLPTKIRSDASYDFACGLARADRADEAMQYLQDAFVYNDRAAVGVLKAWARQDGDLASLAGRADFVALTEGQPGPGRGGAGPAQERTG